MPNIHQSVMGEDAMKDFISKLKELNLKTITGEMIGDDFVMMNIPVDTIARKQSLKRPPLRKLLS